jgi:hypothetical protein
MRKLALTLMAAALALCSQACTNVSSCSRDPDSLTVPLGGDSGSAVEGNVYHSAPYGGPYAYFPPFRTITFEHGLAAIPYSMQFWLAFTSNGTLAPSAGNMTELRDSDDGGAHAVNDQTISVYNNTCSDFYLWVVAERSSQ